jgi:hypothetical protein
LWGVEARRKSAADSNQIAKVCNIDELAKEQLAKIMAKRPRRALFAEKRPVNAKIMAKKSVVAEKQACVEEKRRLCPMLSIGIIHRCVEEMIEEKGYRRQEQMCLGVAMRNIRVCGVEMKERFLTAWGCWGDLPVLLRKLLPKIDLEKVEKANVPRLL